jgi:hypothetical protein
MLPKLKLFADYPDTVLVEWWEGGQSVQPDSLGLSPETRAMLLQWYKTWSRIWILDKGDKPTEQLDWKLYDEQGLQIWKRLCHELVGRFQVLFYSHTLEEDFDDPVRFEQLLHASHHS